MAEKFVFIIDSNRSRAETLKAVLAPLLRESRTEVLLFNSSPSAKASFSTRVYGLLTCDNERLTQDIRGGAFKVPPYTKEMPIYQYGLDGKIFDDAYGGKTRGTIVTKTTPASDELAAFAGMINRHIIASDKAQAEGRGR